MSNRDPWMDDNPFLLEQDTVEIPVQNYVEGDFIEDHALNELAYQFGFWTTFIILCLLATMVIVFLLIGVLGVGAILMNILG